MLENFAKQWNLSMAILRLQKYHKLGSMQTNSFSGDYSFRTLFSLNTMLFTRYITAPRKGEFPKENPFNPDLALANRASGGAYFLKRWERPRRRSAPASCAVEIESATAVHLQGSYPLRPNGVESDKSRERGALQNDLTRETKFPVSSRPAMRPDRRFEPRKEGQVRSAREVVRRWSWNGPWSAGLDCYRWDARVWPYLENANLISVRNGGRPCRKTVKYTTNATGATNPTSRPKAGPIFFECFFQKGIWKRLHYVSICFGARIRRYVIICVIFE